MNKTTKHTQTPWQLKEVNYALVETTRPPMYTAMKYWGKKPHNIWAEFIESYCPPGGVVLDPFAGSAVAGFEAVKLGRRAVCFDLNPLTSFEIETLCQPFDEEAFIYAYNEIFDAIDSDQEYQRQYLRDWEGGQALVYNYRWDGGDIVKLAIETPDGKRIMVDADKDDKRKAHNMTTLSIPFWFPTDSFPKTSSITHKFVKDIGGDGFQYLWTRRNLYILSKIFDEVLKQKILAIKTTRVSRILCKRNFFTAAASGLQTG